MVDNNILYYDIFGRDECVHSGYNVSDGYEQECQHFHGKYELTLVLSSNETNVISGGHSYRCNTPHIRLHRPYSFHKASAEKGKLYERYVFYFTEYTLSFLSNAMNVKQLFRDEFAMAPLPEEAIGCARQLAEIASHEGLDLYMQQFALAGILALAAKYRDSNLSMNGGHAHNYIGKVLEYIGENYAKKLTAAEISKRFYVSEQKLNSDFKETMNETLHHYLVSVKVANAANKISRGLTPVMAAVECGFVDESHFAKTFKSRIGLTPYQFRKSVVSVVAFNNEERLKEHE